MLDFGGMRLDYKQSCALVHSHRDAAAQRSACSSCMAMHIFRLGTDLIASSHGNAYAFPDSSLHSHYSSILKAMWFMWFSVGVLANLTSNHGRVYYHPRCQ